MPVKQREKWNSLEQYIEYLRHLFAYMFAEKYVLDKDVLEIGCGNGYGTYHLGKYAKTIIGTDLSNENISNCQKHYKGDNINFKVANGTQLPFKENTFDVVISFQVIEHISPENVISYLNEIKKVLKIGGVLIITTPNKKLRLLPFQKPWNPEHATEYNKKELKDLFSQVFNDMEIYGLCGSGEVFSIEYNRVKQSYLNVYMVNPLLTLSKPLLKTLGLLNRSNQLDSKTELLDESDVNRFSWNDFKVDLKCPSNCLDLIAIIKND